MLTAQRVRELLDYCPDTGSFKWKYRGMEEFRSSGACKSFNRRYCGKEAGSRHPSGYITINLEGTNYQAHRVMWLHYYGEWPREQIDHINGVKNDNRICNLREATAQENMFNRSRIASNSSGYKGVIWNKKAQCWRARIKKDGIMYHLGLFDDIEEAAEAYRIAAKEMHGEYHNFG